MTHTPSRNEIDSQTRKKKNKKLYISHHLGIFIMIDGLTTIRFVFNYDDNKSFITIT